MGLTGKDQVHALWSGCYYDEKDDATDYANIGRGLQVVGAVGTVRVTTYDNETKNLNVQALGAVIPMLIRRVHTTGTSATGIIVGY